MELSEKVSEEERIKIEASLVESNVRISFFAPSLFPLLMLSSHFFPQYMNE